MGPDWSKITKEETAVVDAIVQRYETEAEKLKALPKSFKRINLSMDIAAAHIALPIDLDRLLAADSTTFMHDIGGISRHINRDTGELGGCFVPRTARRPEPAIPTAARLSPQGSPYRGLP
jgi:hypothetical protein